jgi:FkbM family methyltransferase
MKKIILLSKRFFYRANLLCYWFYYSFKIKKFIKVRKNTSDFAMFKQIFIDKEYDFPLGFIPKTIIDAGANVGFASIWFAINFPNSKIIAIEPEKSNFAVLLKNTSSFKNITGLNLALWNKKTKLNIFDTGFDHCGYLVENKKNFKKTKIVGSTSTTTIIDLMKNFRLKKIDLLKIDIEGAEKEVFDNCSKEWIGKVNSIFIELHDRLKKGSDSNFFKAVKNQDFKTSKSGENFVLVRNRS